MKRKNLAFTVLAIAMLFVATAANAAQPKYVFFFLGDGMASAQIQATEAYLATRYAKENGLAAGPNGGELNAEYLLNPDNRLNMSKMPVQGMQTTYDSFALMPDSASSATAFACGIKTRSGVIGKNDTKTTSYKSVAQLAHESGKKVGIIASVSLDHAPPAAYYASVDSRAYMTNIAPQMAATGYEFFGGGGLASPTKRRRPVTPATTSGICAVPTVTRGATTAIRSWRSRKTPRTRWSASTPFCRAALPCRMPSISLQRTSPWRR